jgi:nucleotide-binding universal stress UspA family protein
VNDGVDPLDAEATKGLDVQVVGVAYDGSPESKRALASGLRFAQARHSTLRLITAVPPLEGWVSRNIAPEELRAWRREEFRQRVERAAGSLPAGMEHETVLRHGRPASVIITEARNGIDVLFIGSCSYGRWAGRHQDDTAAEVMQESPCPVIVVGPGTGLSHVIHTWPPDATPRTADRRGAVAGSLNTRASRRTAATPGRPTPLESR